ncbi:hypothetical protein F5877DRAFT_69837 [Lentinula edodes]|nr:hypothetical protein F5877DRAFT_69837 [Lentinula edodes]
MHYHYYYSPPRTNEFSVYSFLPLVYDSESVLVIGGSDGVVAEKVGLSVRDTSSGLKQKAFHHLQRVSGITSGDVELFNGMIPPFIPLPSPIHQHQHLSPRKGNHTNSRHKGSVDSTSTTTEPTIGFIDVSAGQARLSSSYFMWKMNKERPNRVQLIKEHHQTSEIHDQTQRQPDACKRLVLVKTKKKPLPFAGKEKRKKYYLLFSFKLQRSSFISMLLVMFFSVVVVAIPLSHGKGPASGTTLQCKRNADLPSGQDIPVSLLGPGQSVAYKAPEQSWIYFGNSPCDNGLGFRMGLDKSAKLVVKDYDQEPYDTKTLVGIVHFPSDKDIADTIGRIDDIPSMMAIKQIPLTNQNFIAMLLEILQERKFYMATSDLLLD